MTEAPSTSSVSVLLFLARRTLVNTVLRQVKRLKEPRYIIGMAFAAFYFWSVFLRSFFEKRARGPIPRSLDGVTFDVFVPLAALGVAVLVLLGWVFARGKAVLPLSEAEIHFLFSGPLSRRAVLHYALLKAHAGVLVSSLILALVAGPGAGPGRLRFMLAVWVVMTTINLHFQGLGFTRSRWRELRTGRVWDVLSRVLALFALGALILLAVQMVLRTAQMGPVRTLGDVAVRVALSGLATALTPIRPLVAPLFAPNDAAFLRAFPWALGILALHHFWVIGSSVTFEDATVENAARSAARREQAKGGRGRALPSIGNRGKAPFALRPKGAPELAIFWKNLMSYGRMPLGTRLALVASAGTLFGAAGFLAARNGEEAGQLALGAAALIGLVGTFVGVLVIPLMPRGDFRPDLLYASEMKAWPISAPRLALGELATPLFQSTSAAWAGLLLAVALSGGAALGGASPRELRFGDQLPLALAAALLAPVLAGLLLVVQNAMVLAFPAWFPPGEERAKGFVASGSRMISFLVTMLLLGLAALPSTALGGLVLYLLRGLGFWVAPLVAVAAALPFAAELVGGVFLLGWLFDRFDPSQDLGA